MNFGGAIGAAIERLSPCPVGLFERDDREMHVFRKAFDGAAPRLDDEALTALALCQALG
jgi:hypothetical protein